MSYITFDIPPGVYRTGTDYKSKGRWLNSNLWRWFSGEQRPVGGWVLRSQTPVMGQGRAIITWKDDTSKSWCAVGTNSNLYAMTTSGTVYDITPAGFMPGPASATTTAPYGSGVYGAGVYGYGAETDTVTDDAAVWALDTWGQYLNGVMAPDSKIYEWQLDTGVKAVAVSGAPTARSLVVTNERILMALGADDNPRLVMNSDIQDNTTWTETTINYARQQELQTVGRIMCGRKVTGGTLILTDVDAWLASFLGFPLVYGYEKVGSQCGIVSMGAVALVGTQAFWMSSNGFWTYNGGYAQAVPCDVHDFVFSDINTYQITKVTAVHNSSYGEVWWFYPNSASSTNNRYVVYNYRENHWTIGAMNRNAGVDRGAFTYPLMVDNLGNIWDHERGVNHQGVSPFTLSGPVEIGEGDETVMVRKIVPDEKRLGDVDVTFRTNIYPMGGASVYGPYTLNQNTDVRLSARQVEVTMTAQDNVDFRVGNFRFEVVQRGKR